MKVQFRRKTPTFTSLHCVLTYFHFPQIWFWLLQLPCSLCLHDLHDFSREIQLLKCSQKFLYQYSSSMCCLIWKCPCQKKSTEVMFGVLHSEGERKLDYSSKGDELWGARRIRALNTTVRILWTFKIDLLKFLCLSGQLAQPLEELPWFILHVTFKNKIYLQINPSEKVLSVFLVALNHEENRKL